MDGNTAKDKSAEKKSLTDDISSLKKEMKRLEQHKNRQDHSEYYSLIAKLIIGVGFFFITIFLLRTGEEPLMIASILTAVVSIISLLHVSMDLLFKTRNWYWSMTGALIILLMSGLIILLWEKVLVSHSLLLAKLALIILILITILYLIHMYKDFIENTSDKQSTITTLFCIASWILLLSFRLYDTSIIFFLLVTSTVLFARTSLEHAKRFIKR